MKIFEVLALSRSGHHSIKNWIIRNHVGFQIGWDYKLTVADGTNFYHLGEANHDIDLGLKYLEDRKDTIDCLLCCYEDAPWDYTIFNTDRVFQGSYRLELKDSLKIDHQGRMVFIRDFYNNLSSRIRSNEKNLFTKWNEDKSHLFDVGERYIERWKDLARSCVENKISYLKFEDWLSNQEVREKFLFDNFGIRDQYKINNIRGSQSSFGTTNNVEKRFEELNISDETKDLISKDSELHYLIGRLNYNHIKI